MKIIEGAPHAARSRFGIVVSMYNEFVTSRLLAAAVEVLLKAGAGEEAIVTVRVPGAFELPLAARRLAQSGRVDAVICLGAVIRGETPHFEYVSAEASRGIARAAWESDIPVAFGLITANTAEQALERAGAPERNRGAEAARTAIAMVNVLRQLPSAGRTLTRGKQMKKLTRRHKRSSR